MTGSAMTWFHPQWKTQIIIPAKSERKAIMHINDSRGMEKDYGILSNFQQSHNEKEKNEGKNKLSVLYFQYLHLFSIISYFNTSAYSFNCTKVVFYVSSVLRCHKGYYNAIGFPEHYKAVIQSTQRYIKLSKKVWLQPMPQNWD